MRALIRKVRTGGKTVLLSSHLLEEVEMICDRIGVIQKGRRIIFSLPIPNESFQGARKFFLGQNSSLLADSFAGDARGSRRRS